MRNRLKRWNRPNRPSLLRNEDYSEDANKCRALREAVLRSLVRQREMALTEAWRSRVAGEFFRARPQVRHRIFTARRLKAWKPSRACSGRCCTPRRKASRDATEKTKGYTFTFQPTKRCLS